MNNERIKRTKDANWFNKLILITCLLMSAISYADNSKPSILRFKTIDNPILQSIGEQYATIQDAQGFIWFGGESGLGRFDGVEVKIYRNDPQESNSLSNNWVRDLLVDRQGRLWIATWGGGLNRYNAELDNFTHFRHEPSNPHSISHNVVSSIFERQDGTLWLTTDGGGLNLFDPANLLFTRYQHQPNNPNSLSSNNLLNVLEDSSGIVWLGANGAGLNRFSPKSGAITHYRHNPDDKRSLSHNVIRKIFNDSQGRLWIGTLGGGLNRLDPTTNLFTRYQHDPQDNRSLSNNEIRDIAEGQDGKLWIATDGGGLNVFDPDTAVFIRYQHQPVFPRSLSSNKITSLFQDVNDDWWLGHFPYGISIVDRYASVFTNYQLQPQSSNSLSHNGVLSFVEDRAGKLWIGTENGLNVLDRSTGIFTQYLHNPEKPAGLSASAVLSLLDEGTVLWIGTWAGGLSRFNKKTGEFVHFRAMDKKADRLSDDRVWSIYRDSRDTLWVATYGGLNRYNPEKQSFTHYQLDSEDPTSITSNSVNTIYEDSLGNFWVGTRDGLNLMNRETGTFRQFRHDDNDTSSLSANNIWCIMEDSANNLWLGTVGGGLNKLDRQTSKFIAYRTKHGLPSDTVTGIIEDEQGYFWLSTNQGLSKFDPRTKKFRNYTTAHGLPGNVHNRPAYLKTSKGELVFGSTEGFTIFNPADLFENTLPPLVVFTDFQLFNQSVEIGTENSPLKQAIHNAKTITLTYKQSVFSLGFSALNYRIPEMNQYAYHLEGFDQNWNYIGNKSTATYTNLDAGEYTFRVKASDNDGVWNKRGVSIKIIVLPPWYETLGFRITIVMLVLFGFYLIYFFKTRQIRLSEKRLYVQVKERTKELEESKKDLEEKNRRIEYLANHDTLTSLPSLRLANQRLDLVMSIAKRKKLIAAVLFLDLDGFKTVNDTFGHEAGDYILVEVALRIKKIIRDSDTACRIGGDEFLVILSEVESVAYIDDVCARIITKISEPLVFQGNQLSVGVSIGSAYYPKHGDSGEKLKKIADELMYKVKKKGKNGYLIA